MKYLAILGIWFAAWLLPQYAGGWYDLYFHLFQSVVSLVLMISILSLTDDWWRGEFATVCLLTILYNAGDLLYDFPPENYNDITGFLNGLELAVILGGMSLTLAYRRCTNGNDPSDDSGDNGPDSSARCAQARGRNA